MQDRQFVESNGALRDLALMPMKAVRQLVSALIVSACLFTLAACQTPETEYLINSSSGAAGPTGPAIPAEDVRFALEPFIGAPGNTGDDISRRIAELAGREGLVLTRRNGPDTTHRMTGTLSVTGDDSRGVLIYVFDIFNRSGERVHRFTGQEAIGPSDGDPWAGVDNSSINNLAERTVRSLTSWVNRVPAT